ncbi:anthranilate phosphoribosyltransferase [Legionella sp. W05-934-2]|uniref:anthranilate phosphoribosyltransferase n=1 Tax=Legionella sp. W05-934-2 TaxID=1198649 RepID=UPI00346255C6
MSMKSLFETLINHQDLSEADMKDVMVSMMQGQLDDCQIAAFLALMRSKGHAVTELKIAADIMRQYSVFLKLNAPSVDIVGTGGDGHNTFNVSTVACFVIAAAGVPVAKHGNLSVSSNSGSANFLNEVGIDLNANHQLLQTMHRTTNLCFLFAPNFHPALKHAATARRSLGVRTFFNLLGPLLNPAHVERQVVGVFDSKWHNPLSDVLIHLGSQRHCIVTADDGMDEISIASPTTILEYHQQKRKTWVLDPTHYGLNHASLKSIQVSSVRESVDLGLSVLNNQRCAAKDIVILNAALAIYVADDSTTYDEALQRAEDAIASGKAKHCFETLIQLSGNTP